MLIFPKSLPFLIIFLYSLKCFRLFVSHYLFVLVQSIKQHIFKIEYIPGCLLGIHCKPFTKLFIFRKLIESLGKALCVAVFNEKAAIGLFIYNIAASPAL